MSTWGIVAIVVGILVVAALARAALMGAEEKAARRELRRLRRKERNPDLSGAKKRRYDMMMDPVPGKHSLPGGP
jgi:hypothetical protein